MRRRGNREVNIFNIAFLDVITGALGAFVLLVILLAAQMKKAGSADPAELERLRVANRALTAMVNRLPTHRGERGADERQQPDEGACRYGDCDAVQLHGRFDPHLPLCRWRE
jgi:hypothetical protein